MPKKKSSIAAIADSSPIVDTRTIIEPIVKFGSIMGFENAISHTQNKKITIIHKLNFAPLLSIALFPQFVKPQDI
jgi:hypothetical protein